MTRRGFIGALLGAAAITAMPPADTLTLEQFNEIYMAPMRAEFERQANEFDQKLLDYYKYGCVKGFGWIQLS